ncbi:MAG TPA: spermidine synthase [Geomobilimonas sp.]|nr:spermidine synthase [Geomobilimonas sp.]
MDMIPWQFIGSARVPGGSAELSLYARGTEFAIRVNGCELMNSRVHGSEDALAEYACARIGNRPSPHILIGGLGMGFTTAAALRRLDAESRVVVAELVPAVVEWNRKYLGELTGHPLQDSRVTVREADVALVLRTEHQVYNAILLDVDNGPEGLTRKGNDWLYTDAGIKAAFAALQPAGVLAVWSAGPDLAFTKRLSRAGFDVEEVCVRARGAAGGNRHTIWIATRR